jgi:hypothetical protein
MSSADIQGSLSVLCILVSAHRYQYVTPHSHLMMVIPEMCHAHSTGFGQVKIKKEFV